MKLFSTQLLSAAILSSLVLLPPGVAAAPACHVENKSATEEELLQDVLSLFEVLPHYSFPRQLVHQKDEYIINSFREAGEKIRPIVKRLQQQPTENVKAAFLLANSILYQREWMYCFYLGQHDIDIEAPEPEGLYAASYLFEKILAYLQPDTDIPNSARELMADFVQACGGEETIKTLISWKKDIQSYQVNAQEFKEALSFFKDFCTTLSTENEELCLLQLTVQAEKLQQLCQGKKSELLRVNHLIPYFRQANIWLWAEMYRPPKPYPNPILPKACRTEARLKALQPFFELLPNLRPLVLDTATWQDCPDSAAPDYNTSIKAGDVYGLELFLTEGGGVRLVHSGKEIDTERLREELQEEAEFTNLFVRFVLDKYADIQSEAVQELVHLCESCDVSGFLFALRPEDTLSTTPTGEPLYFLDVVCRIAHPHSEAWVEYYACMDEAPSNTNTAGTSPLIKIKTPEGKMLEYRSQNHSPSVLTISHPWSPYGEYLLLPVSQHGGYLLVRTDDMDSPDFDWSKATPVHALSVWQSPPLYTEPSWEWIDEKPSIRFQTGKSGEIKKHCYDVDSGQLTTESLSPTNKLPHTTAPEIHTDNHL